MERWVRPGVALALAVTCLACSRPEPSARFRLPEGDPGRGQEAFIALRCHACHRVVGLDLPEVGSAHETVLLGGEVANPPEDGEVMTSIINPSHEMADLTRAMSVRQMVDLVAFVRSRYTRAQTGQTRE